MAGRLFFVFVAALGWWALGGEVARADGKYQSTKDGKTLVWNGNPQPGDVATWSGDRDHFDYARGFGRLTWYTPENGAEAPQVYARYWGRMVDGKLEGPVNVHAKRKTHHAIFIDGTRVTRWTAGTAPIGATARWRKLVANRRPNVEVQSEPAAAEEVRRGEPEAPAAGPSEKASSAFVPRPRDYGAIRSAGAGEEGGRQKEEIATSILDTYQERRPKIDIDDSLRLLAFPPRSLRFR